MSQNFSRVVLSNQAEIHPRLVETVVKHAENPWKKPFALHNQKTFDEIARLVNDWNGPVVVDSGCGIGESTEVLCARFPDHLVLGLDKSLVRLSRGSLKYSNGRLFRIDLEDFWRLAAAERMSFARQTFYYPNPWPKKEHRMRRWAHHPVFPYALACGGSWELRTNWDLYAREFELAFRTLTGTDGNIEQWNPENPETPFERKYLASGHRLWRVLLEVPQKWLPEMLRNQNTSETDSNSTTETTSPILKKVPNESL